MLLSGLDSKKYQTVLQFKRSIRENPDILSENIISKQTKNSKRGIDEYGEIAVNRLKVKRIDFNQKQIDRIVELYHSDISPAKICKQFDCCESTIRIVLKKQNVEFHKCLAQDKVNIEVAINMYQDMRSLNYIAKQFGVSQYSVRRVLKDHGVKFRTWQDYSRK